MASEKTRAKKEAEVKRIEDELKNSASVVFAEFRGLDVHESQELRKQLSENQVQYKVIKNTLARIAVRNLKMEEVEEFLIGPTALATAVEDIIAPAKVLHGFAKEHESLKIKGGILEGEVIDVQKVRTLAVLPSEDELLANLVGSLNGPIANLLNVLNGPLRGFIGTMNAIADQKSKAAEA